MLKNFGVDCLCNVNGLMEMREAGLARFLSDDGKRPVKSSDFVLRGGNRGDPTRKLAN